MIVLALLQNIALLFMLSVVQRYVLERSGTPVAGYRSVSGILYGAVAIAGMMTPFTLVEGVIFDGRSIILAIAGLFGGPLAAGIAAAMAAAYRFYLGGAGQWVGVAVITESALIGVVLHYLRLRDERFVRSAPLYAFGLAVHAVMLALMFALPGGLAADVMRRIAVPVIVLYPLGTLLVAKLFVDLEREQSAEELLRANHALLSRVMDTSPIGITVIEPDGCITQANLAAERILGLSKDDILQRSYDSLAWHSTYRDGRPVADDDLPVSRVLRTKQPVAGFVHAIEDLEGERRLLSVNVAPIVSESGGLEAVVATIDDITERDRAESQLRRSMDLLDEAQRLASLGHYVLDFETGMWESSEALEELFGIGPDYPHDVEGWLGLVHPDDREAMRAYLEERVIGRREPFDREYRIVRVSDGQMRWVHGLGRLVDGRDGVLLHMIGTIQDVTEARAVERELKAHRERLEGLVEERTEELRLLNEQLLQATKAKSDFLASMSHELRTPLNSIIGFSGILLRGMAGELNDEQHHQIEMINRSGRTLLALIGDVLDLAKIEAGRIELQPVEFDPAQAVAEIMEDVEPLAREKALETAVIVEEAPASVTVDPAKFGQIVRNMVSNAIKFTATGGVTVTVRGEGADTFCVDVRDTGIGIADEDISRVFEAFKQVEPQDETVAKYSGTGLGLTIARDYARLMGGDITVRSHVGSGTTFTLTLPLG